MSRKQELQDAAGCTAVVTAVFVGGTVIVATAIGCIAFLRWLWSIAFA